MAKEIANNKKLPAQWVWAFEGDADSFYVKDKTRMVVCCNWQKELIWSSEVYSYIVWITSLRIIFALVAYYNLECDAIDIITVYLNAILDLVDVILLKLLPGCKGAKNIVRLHRGMYGFC
jgi:hypothetical protein